MYKLNQMSKNSNPNNRLNEQILDFSFSSSSQKPSSIKYFGKRTGKYFKLNQSDSSSQSSLPIHDPIQLNNKQIKVIKRKRKLQNKNTTTEQQQQQTNLKSRNKQNSKLNNLKENDRMNQNYMQNRILRESIYQWSISLDLGHDLLSDIQSNEVIQNHKYQNSDHKKNTKQKITQKLTELNKKNLENQLKNKNHVNFKDDIDNQNIKNKEKQKEKEKDKKNDYKNNQINYQIKENQKNKIKSRQETKIKQNQKQKQKQIKKLVKRNQKQKQKEKEKEQEQEKQKEKEKQKQKDNKQEQIFKKRYQKLIDSQKKKLQNLYNYKQEILQSLNQCSLSAIKRQSETIQLSQGQKDLLNVINQIQTYYQQTGELNQAVINTQNLLSESTIMQYEGRTNNIGKKQTQVYRQKNVHNQKYNQKDQKHDKYDKIENRKSKKYDKIQQNLILTDSIRKAADQYHEGQQKNKIKKQDEKWQKEEERNFKRSNKFQDVKMTDILDSKKLNKKVKPDSKVQDQFKIKNQQKQETQKQKEKEQAEKFQRQLNQEFELEQINTKNTNMKKVQSKKLTSSKPQKKSKQKLKRNASKQQSKSKKLIKQLNTYPRSKVKKPTLNTTEHSGIVQAQNQMKQSQHHYPKRNRINRLPYWMGAKPKYDSKGNFIQVQNNDKNQLISKIGLVTENLKDFIIEKSTSYNNKLKRYVQNIHLNRGQTLDFTGVTNQFSRLFIELINTRKQDFQLRESIQIYQNDDKYNMLGPVEISPNTGAFILQNVGDERVTLKFTLYEADDFMP